MIRRILPFLLVSSLAACSCPCHEQNQSPAPSKAKDDKSSVVPCQPREFAVAPIENLRSLAGDAQGDPEVGAAGSGKLYLR